MAIGLYGAVSAAKYHERADYHLSQARALVQSGTLPDSGGIKASTPEVGAARSVTVGGCAGPRRRPTWT
jgi:hypothetical protein